MLSSGHPAAPKEEAPRLARGGIAEIRRMRHHDRGRRPALPLLEASSGRSAIGCQTSPRDPTQLSTGRVSPEADPVASERTRDAGWHLKDAGAIRGSSTEVSDNDKRGIREVRGA